MTMVSGGSTYVYRYIYDGQGDVIGLVDVTTGSATVGQEVVTYGYDAWGNEIPSLTTDTSGTNAGTINPFTYRGYVYDSQTGLYYLNARYYNPVTGRFLSEDPIGPNASAVLSYNEYVYAGNNPISNVDPTGMLTWQQAETAVREATGGISKAFRSQETNAVRIVDSYTEGVAYEVKTGYTVASKFVRKQVAKDVQLMKEDVVKSVKWVFTRSDRTGKIGPNDPLKKILDEGGIETEFLDG